MMEQKKNVLSNELFEVIVPLLEEGQSASFYVSGMSMWPFICHKRDSVVIKKADPEKLRIGDIVLLKAPIVDKYLLHRVTHLRKETGEFQTTGDGNCFRDGWFPEDCVVAVVTHIDYRGKRIPVTDGKYKALSTIWRWLYPVRPLLLHTLQTISKIKHRI